MSLNIIGMTAMNYETASDFEINKAVAEALGAIPDRAILQELPPSQAVHLTTEGRLNGWELDYCNNPSDAWPIIVENKITTEWAFTANDVITWRAEITNQGQPGAFKEFEAFTANPLRAAMIVFLMLKAQGVNDNE